MTKKRGGVFEGGRVVPQCILWPLATIFFKNNSWQQLLNLLNMFKRLCSVWSLSWFFCINYLLRAPITGNFTPTILHISIFWGAITFRAYNKINAMRDNHWYHYLLPFFSVNQQVSWKPIWISFQYIRWVNN